VIKVVRLSWLGHLFRMQEQNPCRKFHLHKPEGAGRVGRPTVMWLNSAVEDLTTMGIKNWRRESQHRDQWRVIVKQAKVHNGL
jgi:hypothetical protein